MNDYTYVIDVLKGEYDWRALVFEIAKANPNAVIVAASEFGWVPPNRWREECAALMKAGDRISAIKLYRNRTGSTLKMAVDATNLMVTARNEVTSEAEAI